MVTYSRKQQTIEFTHSLDNVIFNRFTTTQDLGVTFHSRLSFDGHIFEVISDSNRMLGFDIGSFRSLHNTTEIVAYILRMLDLRWNMPR